MQVRARLGRADEDERAALGNVMWYTTTVKLEMEVAGEIRRVDGVTPQRLVRTAKIRKR